MTMTCIRKFTRLVVFLYSLLVRVIFLIDDLCFAVEAGARMRGRNLGCFPLLPSLHGVQAGRRPPLLLPTAADAASVAAGFHTTLFVPVRIQTHQQRAGLNFVTVKEKERKKKTTQIKCLFQKIFLGGYGFKGTLTAGFPSLLLPVVDGTAGDGECPLVCHSSASAGASDERGCCCCSSALVWLSSSWSDSLC